MTDAIQLPNIDIVIPMSGMWLMPYLRNCCAALRRQKYPPGRFGMIVSYLVQEKKEDIANLARLCANNEACLVFTKSKDPAFNISRTKNAGARHGSREVLAFIDADTVLHPLTFQTAARALNTNDAAIVSVARMPQGPDSGVFRKPNLATWSDLTKGKECKRDGVGNIFVRRTVFEAIRGYDERFYGWGGPDTDLDIRLRASGHEPVYLMDMGCSKAMHQFHRATPTKETNYTIRNRKLMRNTREIERNTGGWGRISD